MDTYISIIKKYVPSFKESNMEEPFREAGIDSIDLVTIRVELESLLGYRFSDKDWLNFENFSEIVKFSESALPSQTHQEETDPNNPSIKKIVVNMPQMALEALSENWLFKELGGYHWEKLCEGLNESSFNLADEVGNRLYATFVRIRISCTGNLKAFKENDILNLNGEMSRYGESMYFSTIHLTGDRKAIKANLMTTFSIRNETDNTKLSKSQPAGVVNNIEPFSSFPDFGNEYRLLKKGELKLLESGNFKFGIKKNSVFETTYELNPFYDLNGVNLLYFAAYPVINDVCEARYFNSLKQFEGRWEQIYYTMHRDVFYFSNCNIDEVILYRLNDIERRADGSYILQSELYRKSDNVLMAKIFSVKTRL
jgi:probable biosynthetic protein (TIGR04098 family)